MDDIRGMTVLPPTTERRGDAEALQQRLTDRSLAMRVEGRGGVALLVPLNGPPTEMDAATRRWIVQQGRDAGFANIALEIPEPPPARTPERPPISDPTPERTPEPNPEPTPDPTTPAPIPQEFPGPEPDTAPADAALSRRESSG